MERIGNASWRKRMLCHTSTPPLHTYPPPLNSYPTPPLHIYPLHLPLTTYPDCGQPAEYFGMQGGVSSLARPRPSPLVCRPASDSRTRSPEQKGHPVTRGNIIAGEEGQNVHTSCKTTSSPHCCRHISNLSVKALCEGILSVRV